TLRPAPTADVSPDATDGQPRPAPGAPDGRSHAMNRRLLLLPLLLTPYLAGPASAGIFFGKKPPKPPPEERVPQLLAQLKTDGDETRRVAAAEELRQFDPQAFPALAPALIEALLSDKKPAVRAEAAQTLGKLRPMQSSIAAALEQARDKDPSMRVRLQA